MKTICRTDRLVVRPFNLNDADFIVRLLNEESFIRCIGDKKVRSQEDAVNYLAQGPLASYEAYGFGLNMVQLKGTATPIGICGILKRPELDWPDLGYAFLPEYCGIGYAYEAAAAVLKQGIATHGLSKVLAVTLPNNVSSNSLLKKLGFSLTATIELYGSVNNLYEYWVLAPYITSSSTTG